MGQHLQNLSTLAPDSFESQLNKVASEVESLLDDLLPPPDSILHEAMRYAVLSRGKKFRAYLVVTAAEVFKVSKIFAQRVAAAVEIIHAYSLVHDDLPAMDNADLRRGQLSCHKKYGEAVAILVGDALIPLAFEILVSSKTHKDPKVRLELAGAFALSIGSQGLVAGQMIDLGCEKKVETMDDVIQQERLKTGNLIALSCESGAILAQKSTEERRVLYEYGLAIGQVFQMMDDYLDVKGDPTQIGKNVGQDRPLSKKTFMNFLNSDEIIDEAKKCINIASEKLSIFFGKQQNLTDAAFYALYRDR